MAKPQEFTAACRNGALGTLTFCGKFATLADAEAYCRRQNLLTRDFCSHEVWEGAPDRPRKVVKVVKRD